jgi:hypothetical protein
MKIKVDGNERMVYARSQEWSNIETSMSDTCVTVPNNNSMMIKRMDYDGADYALKPWVRGGAISYNVDLSNVDCGCVAGVYFVAVDEWCGEGAQQNDYPQCASIDVMQANKAGFNVGAHPCANGTCDAISRCQYDLAVEGIELYGPDAYGPGGSIIDTNSQFNVKQAFVSTRDY